MPRYDYMNEKTGDVIEKTFPMKSAPDKIKVKGRVYHKCIGSAVNTPSSSGWPMVSFACGVLPRQRFALMKKAARLGVPTYVTPQGGVEFRDNGHRNKYFEAFGLHDRDAGYRQRAPQFQKGGHCVESTDY